MSRHIWLRIGPGLACVLLLGTALLHDVYGASARDFLLERIDTSGLTGHTPSVVLDGLDNPHIAYIDSSANALRYARRKNGIWTIETVPTVGGILYDGNCSLALDDRGRPVIAYFFHGPTYGSGPGISAKSGSTWSFGAVSQAGTTGQYISLALDKYNVPHLTYYDLDNTALTYAVNTGPGTWSIETVDSNGKPGVGTSLALDQSGYPHVAYHEFSGGSLRYAYKDSHGWTLQEVAAGQGYRWGWAPALVLDTRDDPHIVCWRTRTLWPYTSDLVHLNRFLTNWYDEVIEAGSDGPSQSASIVQGPGGDLHVTYGFSPTPATTDLRYATHASGPWVAVTVDQGHVYGRASSVAIDALGHLHIAYDDRTDHDLLYATVEWTNTTPAALAGMNNVRGVSWPDVDQDGWPDLYIADLAGPNLLLANTGTGFTDITSGPEGTTLSVTDAAFGDADNDGDIDLYLTSYYNYNMFLRNQGAGTFADATGSDLFGGPGGQAASWVDYDRDGWLDLFLSNSNHPNQLLRNLGNGTFADVSPHILAQAASTADAWADVDLDGDQDLFLAGSPNTMFRNDGGAFTDVVTAIPVGSGQTKGCAWGDYDNDGDPDLYVTQAFGSANGLFRNDGDFNFTDVTGTIINDSSSSWDASWIDFDNDGDLDLYVVNDLDANRMFRNDGSGIWTDVAHGPMTAPGNSRSAAWADYDRDGDPDVVIGDRAGGSLLVRNDFNSSHHWLQVKLEGTESNRQGIGARIRISDGSNQQTREITGGDGFTSQNSAVAEFGLGTATVVPLLEVRWPSGIVQTLQDVSPVDRVITILEENPFTLANAWTIDEIEETMLAADLELGTATVETGPFVGPNTATSLTEGPDPNTLYLLRKGDYEWMVTIDLVNETEQVVQLVYPYSQGWTEAVAIAYDRLSDRIYCAIYRSFDDIIHLELGTVDPVTGWVHPLGELSFVGSPVTYGIKEMAFSPSGELFAITAESQTPFSLWTVSTATLETTFLGANLAGHVNVDDMTFLGSDLWVLQDWFAGRFLKVEYVPGVGVTVPTERILNISPVRGLAARDCGEPEPFEFTARDAPEDEGGSILLDWSEFIPPGGTTGFEVVRSQVSCELFDPLLEPIGGEPYPGPSTFLDTPVENYKAYYYGLRAVGQGKATLATLLAGPVHAYPNVVINEFAPAGGVKKVGEKVELKNLTTGPINLTGFRLSNGIADEPLSGVIPAGGFHVHILAIIDLPDAGGTLTLLPPAGSDFAIDTVDYGTESGVPSVPFGYSISRVDGTDADDPDEISFSASQPTPGANNSAAPSDLGSSLLFNEVYFDGNAGNDYVEIINPLGSTIQMQSFVLSDGVAFMDTLDSAAALAPGSLMVLDTTSPDPFTRDLVNTQLYLYQLTSGGLLQLIDQLGWGQGLASIPPPGPASPDDAVCRTPDGGAVYLGNKGANWVDCGGGTWLRYALQTPGEPNRDSLADVITLDAQGTGDYPTIAAAMGAASAGTKILLLPGTYNESVAMAEAVELIGLNATGEVILAGNGTPPILTATGLTSATAVRNLTIGPAARGAELSASSIQFHNVHFRNNTATSTGGAAVHILGAAPLFSGCVFEKNSAVDPGGAILISNADPLFDHCLFVRNEGPEGAAIFAMGGGATLRNCVVDRNRITKDGGAAISAQDAVIDVEYSVITGTFGGQAMNTSGPGSIAFHCGGLFANAVPVGGTPPPGVTLGDYLQADPMFCQPLNLNYYLQDGSPLIGLAATCGHAVGMAGTPCNLTLSDTGPLPETVARSGVLAPTPNPFNAATTLNFNVAVSGAVDLTIHDLRGRLVAAPVEHQTYGPGRHGVEWRGLDRAGRIVASGVYLVRMRIDGRDVGTTHRMVLLK